MKIRTVSAGSAAIVSVEGRMDAESCGDFYAVCVRALEGGALNIVADLNALRYISSAGIGTLAKLAGHLKKTGGEIVLASLQGLVREVLELTRLIGIFRVFDSVEAALASLP